MMKARSVLRLGAAIPLVLLAGHAAAQYSTPMRDVESPDRNAFVATATGGPTPPFANGFVNIPTPLGFRYFVSHVSLVCITPTVTDQITLVQMITLRITGPNSTSSSAIVPFTMTRVGASPFGGYTWVGSAMVRAFSDANPFASNGGSGITFNIFRTEAANNVSCTATVNGHALPN